MFKKFKNQKGASFVEYAVLLFFMGGISVGAVSFLAEKNTNVYEVAQQEIEDGVSNAVGGNGSGDEEADPPAFAWQLDGGTYGGDIIPPWEPGAPTQFQITLPLDGFFEEKIVLDLDMTEKQVTWAEPDGQDAQDFSDEDLVYKICAIPRGEKMHACNESGPVLFDIKDYYAFVVWVNMPEVEPSPTKEFKVLFPFVMKGDQTGKVQSAFFDIYKEPENQ